MMDRGQLIKDLTALREGRVPPQDVYHVIHVFGETNFTEAEPDVAQFLVHDNPNLRYIAVSVLSLHWNMVKYRREFERIMVDDTDEDVRRIAARGLGYVLQGTHDEQATRLLIATLRDVSEDLYVRQAAYNALMLIWLPPIRKQKFEQVMVETSLKDAVASKDPNFKTELHVDWDAVKAMERGEVP